MPQLRVLVYQLGSLGDTVVTIPALKAVRRHYGDGAEIFLMHAATHPNVHVTPEDVLGALNVVSGYISYPFEARLWRKVLSGLALGVRIKGKRFDSVVYLAPSERRRKSVLRDELFFRLCGISQRVGFYAFSPDILYPADDEGRPKRASHEASRRLERLRLDGFDVSLEQDLSKPFLVLPQEQLTLAGKWLGAKRQYHDRTLVAVCPGAKQPANIWPVERFIEIGHRLISKKRFEIIVIGGPAERQVGRDLLKEWGTGVNAAGECSLIQSAALLSSCALLIGLDTGTTHLAAAMGVPCIALHGGREHPGQWEPLGIGHQVLRHPVACAGCRLSVCPVEGHPCMLGLSVDEVWKVIEHVCKQLETMPPTPIH